MSPVLVVGAGLSGIATALGVALRGGEAVVFESSPLIGGAAAASGGMVWCAANHVMAREGLTDSLDLGEAYVRGISHAAPELIDEQALQRWLTQSPVAMEYWERNGAITWEIIPDLADYHAEAPGALPLGRYLTNAPISGSALGRWRERLRVGTSFPIGMTYAEMHLKGRRGSLTEQDEDQQIATHGGVPAFGSSISALNPLDRLTFGTGVVASFLARAVQEPGIAWHIEAPVADLLVDARGSVTGLVATVDGERREFHGPVVLATSTYDWNPALVKEFLGLDPEDFSSLAPTSLDGSGIEMAVRAGADIARVPATSVPIVPGWSSHAPTGVTNGPEYALPHCFMVDSTGQRFADDSYWVSIVKRGLGDTPRHLPFYLIWDEQHHRKYGLGLTPPGGEYPREFVHSASSLEALALSLEIDPEGLVATASGFNAAARAGVDPEFGRDSVDFVKRFCGDPAHEPNPVLGAVDEPPFFGTRLKFVGTGIGSSGIRIDGDGRVLNAQREPIGGLYAAGSVAALTAMGSGYNSGFALGRGLTLAMLIAEELVPSGTT